jgi:hypothetical protein
MTVVTFPRRWRRWLPAEPAFGIGEPLGWRSHAVRVAFLIGLLGIACLVRVTGLLHPNTTDPRLPPAPAVALVAPGVVRGSQPQDLDLVRMRDDYGIHALVDLSGWSIEERAAARGLGLRMLVLPVPDRAAPSAADVLTLVRFLHPTGSTRAGGLYLHDATGRGPVVVVAAMLRLLHGAELPRVLHELSRDELADLSGQQLLALQDVDAAVRGRAPPTAPYATLRGVSW